MNSRLLGIRASSPILEKDINFMVRVPDEATGSDRDYHHNIRLVDVLSRAAYFKPFKIIAFRKSNFIGIYLPSGVLIPVLPVS
jgi:hypothetical protein